MAAATIFASETEFSLSLTDKGRRDASAFGDGRVLLASVPSASVASTGFPAAPAHTAVSGASTAVYAQSANLDFLRSFAVLAVLGSHIGSALRFHRFDYAGRIGVLLFFVHTALVLLQSLGRLHADGRGCVAARFFASRIFRIYPLYLAAIVFSLALRVPWVEALGARPSSAWLGWKPLVAGLLMIQNLTFSPSVSAPMWSLPYEMQMYLALPLVYILASGKERFTKLVIVCVPVAMLALVQLVTSPGYNDYQEPLTYFAPCFMGGAFAFARCAKRQLPAIVFPAFLACSIALCSSWGPVVQYLPFTQWAFCIALGLMLPSFAEIRINLIRRVSAAIAKYSYGIYLWHWPLLWLCFRRFDMPMAARFALFLALLAGMSISSYHLIEAPMIRFGRTIR